jgi:hypothetical protein
MRAAACPLELWVEHLGSEMAVAEQLAKRHAPVW